MAHPAGTACKLYPNTGTYATPVYTALEGELTSEINIAHAPRDTTDKDDNDWRTYIKGIRDVTGSFTARGDSGNSAQDQWIDDIAHATAVPLTKMEWKTFDSNKYSADIFPTGCVINSDLEDVVGISGDWVATGPITQAAA